MTTNSSRTPRNASAPDGPGTPRHSVYTRFIPREELGSFAAWEPNDLSRPEAAPNTAAPAEDGTGIESAEQIAERHRQARQAGYQEGYRDGLVALEGFKQSFAHQTTLQVGALLQSFGKQLDALQRQMAEALCATATGIARQAVRSELRCRPGLVAAVAQEALETLLLSARHITLRVHPDDHALVADGAGDVIAARGARLIADPAIERGGCLVESDIGAIDASLDTRWRRAAAALGSDPAWNAPDEPAGAASGSSA
jgi:flagellar assembly protein FliH